ncbi:hypothetical protein CBS147320_1284 [Aspergillus niger]|nr:hypothetical protein CBS133816_4189 [Aspergillus niger]KAI2911447.1 hypothetical protein CBS147371_8166 [Aspergillus niger]KAI2934046.1 hypothetical protein CBS147320_1284 [Aspergillus niger]KAI3015680.1 hypothetical protein CBS147482_3356 [Aspergillus niger]
MENVGIEKAKHTSQNRPVNVTQTLSNRDREGHCELDLMRLYDRVGKLSESLGHELSTLRCVSVDGRDTIGLMRQENAKLKKCNQTLEEQLQDCQARILKFSLSSDLSDTTVMQEFVKIRDNLSNWIEGLPEICADFDTQLECALEGFQCYLYIFGGMNSYPQGTLGVQSELLMHIVFRRLEAGLLKASVPGMLASEEALLRDLHAGMVSLQSKRDVESLTFWRTNTIRAYVACQRHEKGVNEEFKAIINDLHNLFCWLAADILKPAASLATKMSSSPSEYRWEWYGKAYFSQGVVRKQHMELFIVQDARTHTRIPIANIESLPAETPIGELLVIVFPALFRCADGGHEDIPIEKAVILIRANEELQRQ